MRLVVAATATSGAIYLQRLLDYLDTLPSDIPHEIHLIFSSFAHQVIHEEINELQLPKSTIIRHSNRNMNAPFASGSTRFDAMIIIPCSMGTLGRIVAGTSESLILRSADVFLKERRKLILVVRETPWNLIHAKNVTAAIEAGAIFLPAMPSFYSKPNTIREVADTVVWRVLDQLGLPALDAYRWKETPHALPSR
ncbi:Phenolic acid decarboxylase subunit B [Candidatus Xiphinematobacter sp. Idaho Grape]|uniref:UbiX family flavin prenyltransferase n=1 Tax=Candidatus Xiphinematobacter sp. Idaho Grape TaxID=1704307 RepID=UPI000705CCD8|nr:UbiX family flavin prenyltransferase [Candidatus Xiphinematobacter sp. Idaho Grape]ALJ56572.1 Phenolic acid decarboxylase subunit B [Candidatus Xiphinematobacter sp. Idaho Grape]